MSPSEAPCPLHKLLAVDVTTTLYCVCTTSSLFKANPCE